MICAVTNRAALAVGIVILWLGASCIETGQRVAASPARDERARLLQALLDLRNSARFAPTRAFEDLLTIIGAPHNAVMVSSL